MSRGNRKAKTFTLEPGVLSYVQRTRGRMSASERVNRMLKRAMQAERLSQFEREAAEFYAEQPPPDERKERAAYQRIARRILARDDA